MNRDSKKNMSLIDLYLLNKFKIGLIIGDIFHY